jgi:hypothetical protein
MADVAYLFYLEFGLMPVTNEALNTWKCKVVLFHDTMAYRRIRFITPLVFNLGIMDVKFGSEIVHNIGRV